MTCCDKDYCHACTQSLAAYTRTERISSGKNGICKPFDSIVKDDRVYKKVIFKPFLSIVKEDGRVYHVSPLSLDQCPRNKLERLKEKVSRATEEIKNEQPETSQSLCRLSALVKAQFTIIVAKKAIEELSELIDNNSPKTVAGFSS